MSSMDTTLPGIKNPQPQSDGSANQSDVGAMPANGGAGLGQKETELPRSPESQQPAELKESGIGTELPKEVARAGVRMAPVKIPVSQQLQASGVKPAGDNISVGTGNTVTLPLTDDQIAEGLKKDLSSSWRWLAEWCMRKLKQLHRSLLPGKHGSSMSA